MIYLSVTKLMLARTATVPCEIFIIVLVDRVCMLFLLMWPHGNCSLRCHLVNLNDGKILQIAQAT